MNITKALMIAMSIALLAALPIQAVAKQNSKVAVIVVFDDSGAWFDKKDQADQIKVELVKRLLELKKRKKTRHAIIDFISSSTGSTELTTQPLRLSKDWKQIETLLKSKPTRCNNLVRTFQTLRSTILEYEQEGMQEIYIYMVSSFIDLESPCNFPNLVLPQKPPVVDLDQNGQNDLGEVLTRSEKVKTILIYGVKSDQFEGWYNLLYPSQWVKKDPENKFRMKILKKTGLALQDGLFIRRDR